MNHCLTTILALLFAAQLNATELWSLKPSNTSALPLYPQKLYQTDDERLRATIEKVHVDETSRITIPLPSGEMAEFELEYAPIYSDSLAQQYPEIRTFIGKRLDKSSQSGRFDLTPQGFHGMFKEGDNWVYIDPVNAEEGTYKVSWNRPRANFYDDVHELAERSIDSPALAARGISQLRRYRLAVATTGEYTSFHGGQTGAQSAITTTINRVNQIFLVDLGIELQLVDTVIFTNQNTDPFDNGDASIDVDIITDELDAEVGAANYDVGHLFGTGGGGIAFIGAVCSSAVKGGGVSGLPRPTGESFAVDIVTHELGHQFGADHTFNGTQNSCASDQRNNSTAYEPGSGSTIMAYSGICGADNLQVFADSYFHAGSISQIRDFITNRNGRNCGSAISTTNNDPEVDAGSDFTVPTNTPLILTGSATDIDPGATLSYVWEQLDAGTGNSNLDTDPGFGPLFRSFPPTADPVRYIPRLADVIDGSLIRGETFATTNRDMNFRLTVRDGSGGVESDSMVITVSTSSGPFQVTAPAANTTVSNSVLVQWDPAGTNALPVNCSSIDVLLDDGDLEFDQALLTATPNDGSQTVPLPSNVISQARLMLRCSNNIFYAVSPLFRIEPGENQDPIANNDSFDVRQGSGTVLLDVLSNDTEPDLQTLTLTDITYNGVGTAFISGDQISYTPAASFTGVESLSYTVSDGEDGSASATATITVSANQSPIANDDSLTVTAGGNAVQVNVVGNDSDPDSDEISLLNISAPSIGSAAITGGQVIYNPPATVDGVQVTTIQYTVTDEFNATDTGTLTITINPESSGGSGGGGGSLGWWTLTLLLCLMRLRR